MFKSWLTANLGFVYFFCIIVIIGISYLVLPTTTEEEISDWIIVLLVIGVISIPVLFGAEPTIGPIVSLILLAGLYMFVIYTLKHPENGVIDEELASFTRKVNIVTISLTVVSIIPSIIIARYANINFYDVVSTRWLYRNSDKDVFETTWKYTFNRFCMSFLVFFCLILSIVALASAPHWLSLTH